MGEAKRRGTYEERKAAAIKRDGGVMKKNIKKAVKLSPTAVLASVMMGLHDPKKFKI